ncbi:MAG TPA: DUF3320 domain-containing protein [Thermoanaerobaculia bacterium]|jgi:very-short-patch-repair endonuclease
MSIARELETARQSLLDLTLRNRLLNYRPSSVRSIRVTGELPAESYDALVLREKSLEFRGTGPRRKTADAAAIIDPDAEPSTPVHRHLETWTARDAAALEAKHTDRFLQTPYDDESLARKLFRVYHEGRSAVEEQGYTVAHLALGFLEWYESADADQPRRAPLILVPAELERVRAGDFSKVKWTGEDVFANISLSAKLVELGVALPPFEAPEEKAGIDAWLQKVADAIARKPRWRVLSELTLDFFSFTKFVMFKDLDPATWPDETKPHDHPLLRTLFRPTGTPSGDGLFDERAIDTTLTARDLWHVMDADPSQIAVLQDVKRGQNLVVQGPPGTGKSQTITNLIAESLSAGRTVLFVSEKMAALEVVKTRLDGAGLGPFCLELHSRKSNKKAVIAELKRALHSTPLPSAGEQLLEEHELLKRELNLYASELGTPVGRLQRTPYRLFGERQAALARLDGAPELVRLANIANVTEGDAAGAQKALRELAYVMPLVQPAAAHPWRASTRDTMLPHQEEELRALLARAAGLTRGVAEAAAVLAQAAGVQQPKRLADVERALRAADILTRADAPTETSLLLSEQWNAPNADAEALVRRIEEFQRERAGFARTFNETSLEASSGRELDEFARRASSLFRIFSGRYRVLRRQIAAMYVTAVPKTAQMVADLSRLVEHQSVRDALRGDTRGRGLFGARWKSDRSDCAALRQFAEWLIVFRRELLGEALTRRAVEVASGRVDSATIHAHIERLGEAAKALRAVMQEVLAEVAIPNVPHPGNASPASETTLDELPFDTIAEVLARWQEQTGAFFTWCRFNAARKALRATAAAPLEALVTDDRLEPHRLLPFFEASLAESLLRAAFGERPSLGQFSGELHEQKIARFRELDRNLVAVNRARLSRRLHQARPQINGGASPGSELGILKGEMERKRGHMPIRKLLARAGGLIQRIKPCFLMSPLSVAQFLDPRSTRFDLIVFDEASQVRPEDAVGAMLRGTQLVVMGDTQQLPPTSFFDHLAAGDGDASEEEAALTDVESILHQCARSYPSRMLEWHYRSRHESLIAISNLHFYDNHLRIYPAAIDAAPHLGVHFVHVPRGVYDRGATGMNRIEAQTVAAAALDHYRRHPDKSLGIGTFNVKQQQAIQEELEAQLRAHPEIEGLFRNNRREPLFVKNLETIQGDERDVIFISLGYGRTADGKLRMNFGPLNYEGGERRLNVLISRAREKCVVYSNFRAHDLVVEDPAKQKGLAVLKAFLDYAESRHLAAAEPPQEEHERLFEDSVAEVLRAEGYDVKTRVGCAPQYRLDLAVVDPREPGRYLLGIECDGANYHGSPVARDRDRLRQQILTENLGWTIHRVWSTDWYRNRAATVARLLRAVEEAKHAVPPVAPPPDVEPVEVLAAVEDAAVIPEPVALVEPAPDVDEYEVCRALRIPIAGELHLVGPSYLAVAVEDVVTVEGPVHVDEVVRRIRTLWGLQRAGNRIREAIEQATRLAISQRRITADGEFLHLPNGPVRPRRRNGDPPAKIDLIADAEIVAAVHHVLRTQFATEHDDLVSAAARRLGIQSTSGGVFARIAEVIAVEVARGGLSASGDVVREV